MPALVLPYPRIDPVIFELGPFAIRWYALAYIAGLLLGMVYMKRLVRDARLWKAGATISAEQVDDFLLWCALGVILGGRTGYVLFYNPGHFMSDPAAIFAVWQGGMSFHGGFLGVIVAVIVFCRVNGLNPLTLLDLAAAAVPIGLFFGRIANFINGELFGRVTDVPWAMVFPLGGPDPRHPSQLYEAALEGIVLFLLLRIATHRFRLLDRPGHVAGLFAIGYGAARIGVEFFRMPDAQIGYFAGWLTMGMLLSLPMLVVGAILVINARRKAG